MTGLDPHSAPFPMPEASFDPWNFPAEVDVSGGGLVGYRVEAADGVVGKVADASYGPQASYLVITVGSRLFGTNTLIPAGCVNHVDRNERKVYVTPSKAEIKAAPNLARGGYENPTYRDKIGSYYGEAHGRT